MIRDDFPMLKTKVHGKDLVYFDSAATSQKPLSVIRAMSHFYENCYSTVNRAVYATASQATYAFHEARKSVQGFINASSWKEVIFTKGATDSINILQEGLSFPEGSCILVSMMEHHANLVPWQMLAKRQKLHLKPIPIHEDGTLNIQALHDLLHSFPVKAVVLSHVSNVLGHINPISEIAPLVHDHGSIFIVDGAQSVAHLPIDVQKLGCDAFCFSAHKMFGPTGIGVLWGKEELLYSLTPSRGGGDMVDKVTFDSATYQDIPLRFEPGTPPIVEAIGFQAAISYINSLSKKKIQEIDERLSLRLQETLSSIKDIHLIGTATPRVALQSFVIPGIHPLDLGTFLDMKGIAIRTGTLCCQPLLKTYSLDSVCRASLSIYNTEEEIAYFMECLKEAIRVFGNS